ncbi:MAG: tetratricopeptide repeat protein [bacterium]|nr:MAG: tetratricopeptide repeat protein [bacterium]
MQNPDMLTELLIVILVILVLVIIYYYTRVIRKPKGEKSSYLNALEYLADGNEKWAIQKFKEAVREDTENIDAYLRLADLLRKKGLTSNAMKIHKDLTLRSNLSPEMRNKIQYSLLLDYEELGNYKSAIDIAEKLLEKSQPFQKEISIRLISYLEKEEQWGKAYEFLRKYFKDLTPQHGKKAALYLVFEGLKIQEKGEGREARIKFKEAFKIDTECVAAYYHLGNSYYEENRLTDAIREWERLCDMVPQKSYFAFENLEKAWFDLGKFKEAETLYKKILNKDSRNVHAAIALSEIYNKKEEYDRALDVLERVIEEVPDNPRLLGYKLHILINKNQYKQAAQSAQDYFEIHYPLADFQFICQECQYKTKEPQWICPQCKSINSFDE